MKKHRITAGCLVAFFALLTGCGSVAAVAGDDYPLSFNPIHEERMTLKPEEGYGACAVWRVHNPGNGRIMFMAGSIHVLRAHDIPLPSPYYAAYNHSAVMYSETGEPDSFSFFNAYTMARTLPAVLKLAWKSIYFLGGSLENHVSPATREKLKERFGGDYGRIIKLTPVGLMMELTFQSNEGGVETIFDSMARTDNKPHYRLDDLSIAGTASMTVNWMVADLELQIKKDGVDAVVLGLIGSNEDAPTFFQEIRGGNLEGLDEGMMEMMAANPMIYDKLLVVRNRKWMKRLNKILQSEKDPTAFVLVGAAHMVGEHGLLYLLRKEGYVVEQLYGIDRPESNRHHTSSSPSGTNLRLSNSLELEK